MEMSKFYVVSTVILSVITRVEYIHATQNEGLANSGSFSGVDMLHTRGGGIEAVKHEFPFIVSFSRDGDHFAGGTIIEPEWVLTSAHSASEPDFNVTAGDHNLNIDEGSEQRSRAVLVIRNPNYNPITYEDDISLVKVSPPFQFDEYVQPFSLPSTHFVATGNATVVGWITENVWSATAYPLLQKVTMPLVPSLQCAAQYGSYFHPLKMICAGVEEGGKDACEGQGGGPLICEDSNENKNGTLCGIASFGLGCARPELPGVYTKVAYYSDWIDYQMRVNSGNKQNVKVPTRMTSTTLSSNRDTSKPPLKAAPASTLYKGEISSASVLPKISVKFLLIMISLSYIVVPNK